MRGIFPLRLHAFFEQAELTNAGCVAFARNLFPLVTVKENVTAWYKEYGVALFSFDD